ncbi:MAG TPA: AMP-binding protein, partial [Pyrinomonadaceae bacterium]
MQSTPLIFEEIEKAVSLYPEHTALLQLLDGEGEVRYTFRQTLRLAKNLSRALKGRGFGKGDKVVFWAPLSPHWVIAYLGVLYSGCVVVPLDVEYGSDELAFVLAELDSRLIFTTREKLPLLRSATEGRPAEMTVVSLNGVGEADAATAQVEELFEESEADPAVPPVSPEDVATIFYTSGTTGKPKGVVIEHGAVAAGVLSLKQYIEFIPGDNVLAVVPAH